MQKLNFTPSIEIGELMSAVSDFLEIEWIELETRMMEAGLFPESQPRYWSMDSPVQNDAGLEEALQGIAKDHGLHRFMIFVD